MNKQDLIEFVQKAANIETKVAATAAVNAVLDGITEGIKKGGPNRKSPRHRAQPQAPIPLFRKEFRFPADVRATKTAISTKCSAHSQTIPPTRRKRRLRKQELRSTIRSVRRPKPLMVTTKFLRPSLLRPRN